ncbi:transposase [Enterocloster clostridioformis]
MYATRERKLMKEAKGSSEEPVEKIERKWLISLLYKPLDDIKKISKEQLDKVIENYPLIGTIHDIVKSFKNTLFSKEPAELEKWLEEAEKLEIEQISSFVNGIRRDMDAVKKAIELDYNNGLAEGSVNKLKVVKRIMYGRNSFELLKGKLLRLELRRRIN